MDTEITTKTLTVKEGIPVALEQIFSDKPTDTQQLENRWKNGFNAIFSYMTKSVSNFFVSHKKSEEITQNQSFIRRLICKSDYIEKIKSDYERQNAFLLGYCHAIHQLIDSFELETSYQENNMLKEAIFKHKHITPILKILDNEIELSHNELAEKIDVSAQSLSNLMNEIKKYQLFNETKIGKNKYYSLAYPNGKQALKIAKKNNSVDKYTKLLLEMMDSLIRISTCDELGKENLNRCNNMFMQYTTNPSLCKKNWNNSLLFLNQNGFIVNL